MNKQVHIKKSTGAVMTLRSYISELIEVSCICRRREAYIVRNWLFFRIGVMFGIQDADAG